MNTPSTSVIGYTPPKGEWERREPDTLGFDSTALKEALKFAEESEIDWPRNLHERAPQGLKHPNDRALGLLKDRSAPAGLVIRNGYIAAEYGDPSGVEVTFSCTKSYIATLVGLAVDQGKIRNVDDLVSKYVKDGGYSSPQNSSITWRHSLQQTSEWEGELFGLPDTIDRGRVISTDARMDAGHEDAALPHQNPGDHWEYNDVRVNRTALSLLRVYEEPLPSVLRKNIMDPIGASNSWEWHGYSNSVVDLNGVPVESVSGGAHWGGGLWIDTFDHARFGLLYLRRGRWGDQQIISESWVDAMTESCRIKPDYGYLWWLNHEGAISDIGSPKSFAARGAGGNVVYVEPDMDIVVVIRWSNDTKAVIDRILSTLVD